MHNHAPPSLLVVDDIAANITLIEQVLKGEGYDLRAADSGPAALELARQSLPDLAILDVMMPEMDGIETCRRLKAMAEPAFLPVALITARDDAALKREGLRAGAEEFINKPFDPEELIARIRNLVRTKRLYDDLSESHRQMEADVQAIAALQRSLLPSGPPALAGVAMHEFYLPSRTAGGDYYDYVEIDERRLGIAIGDAAGHGPQASVIMAITKTALHMSEARWRQPAALLREINRQLRRFVPPEEFVTLFYGVLDLEGETLRYASAAHCRPIVFGPRHPEPRELDAGRACPLGLIDDLDAPESEIPFAPGDRLMLYTDGVTEAGSPGGEFYRTGRLIEKLSAEPARPGPALIASIVEDLRSFCGGEDPRDDCTLLLVESCARTES